MPLATFTGTAAATHVVRQEEIDAFLAGFNYPPPVGVAIAASKPGKGTVPIRFPRLGAISVPAGTLAETVDAVDVNVATAENALTPARVAFAVPISKDLLMNQDADHFPTEILSEIVHAAWSRIHADLCLGSLSSTNQAGSTADPFTLAAYRALKAAWRALEVPPGQMGTGLMLAGDALSQLEESAASAGSPFALRPSDSIMFSSVHGYQGRLGDFDVFSSSQVADEATGKSNWVTPIGNLSGIGIVMSQLPTITLHIGNDGLRRAVIFAHVEMYFAAGIVNQTRFLEYLSS